MVNHGLQPGSDMSTIYPVCQFTELLYTVGDATSDCC